ncbi:MAG: hypothetical protein Kow0032_24760 [Methyloligellaceae bacterium]
MSGLARESRHKPTVHVPVSGGTQGVVKAPGCCAPLRWRVLKGKREGSAEKQERVKRRADRDPSDEICLHVSSPGQQGSGPLRGRPVCL